MKTDRLVVSSNGLTTRNLIYEQVDQRRGTRDFITTKPYAKLVATLATDRPDEEVAIPAFNPMASSATTRPLRGKISLAAN